MTKLKTQSKRKSAAQHSKLTMTSFAVSFPLVFLASSLLSHYPVDSSNVIITTDDGSKDKAYCMYEDMMFQCKTEKECDGEDYVDWGRGKGQGNDPNLKQNDCKYPQTCCLPFKNSEDSVERYKKKVAADKGKSDAMFA
ncbi:predicted protein [Nematostella vectensis]|uniref:Uncharacterized protein n=1 Tax=Nematostella vectensis TaxID=45351 RepID=A7RNS2_NEMVE|nr:uncharacterized protein LOC125565806 [Nematostella vectensis]EDO46980.1 predicted protein [Nematostella vectensis]|eukprot:XP_001639043.1 predicted protein [Nematostella vectensis]